MLYKVLVETKDFGTDCFYIRNAQDIDDACHKAFAEIPDNCDFESVTIEPSYDTEGEILFNIVTGGKGWSINNDK